MKLTKYIFPLLLLSLSLGACALGPPKPMASSTIELMIGTGGNAHGSGVYLGENVVLTAAHVVDAGVVSYNGLIAETIWKDADYDLAMVRIPELGPVPPRKLLCQAVKVGEKVYLEGYPFDLGKVLTQGTVASTETLDYSDKQAWKKAQVLDATAGPGMSGGPVMNSTGDIIGTVVAGTPGYGFALMVPSTVACELRVKYAVH